MEKNFLFLVEIARENHRQYEVQSVHDETFRNKLRRKFYNPMILSNRSLGRIQCGNIIKSETHRLEHQRLLIPVLGFVVLAISHEH